MYASYFARGALKVVSTKVGGEGNSPASKTAETVFLQISTRPCLTFTPSKQRKGGGGEREKDLKAA